MLWPDFTALFLKAAPNIREVGNGWGLFKTVPPSLFTMRNLGAI